MNTQNVLRVISDDCNINTNTESARDKRHKSKHANLTITVGKRLNKDISNRFMYVKNKYKNCHQVIKILR